MTTVLGTLALLALLPSLLAAPAVQASPAPPDRAPAATPAWAPAGTATIHPGVPVVTGNALCTANYVYLDGDDVLMGIAAHCAGLGDSSDTNGCDTPSLPLGTTVEVEGAEHPAELVYSSWLTMQAVGESDPNACEYNDLALARLDPRDVPHVNPSMPTWGGPLGLSEGSSTCMSCMYTYGEVTGGPQAKRANVEAREGGGWRYVVRSVSAGVPGDSGSGYLDRTGRAVGVLSTLEVLPRIGANGLTDLRMALDYAATHTSLDPRVAVSTEPFVETGEEPPPQPSGDPTSSEDPDRIAGIDRYATAAEVAAGYDQAGAIFVATGVEAADALAAGPAAASIGSPLLLSGPSGLSTSTLHRIRELGPRVAYLVGGTSAVPDAVRSQLAGVGVEAIRRIAGADRYATAARLATTFRSPGAPVVLASGTSFADALGAAPFAAHRGAAVLLTAPTRLPAATRDLLASWRSDVTIVGGPSAVSRARAAEVEAATGTAPSRVSGRNRYETAVEVTRLLLTEGGYDFGGRLWLASGQDFPDALAAGPATHRDRGMLVLVPPTGDLPAAVGALVSDSGADQLAVLGGATAISDDVVEAVRAALAD